MSFFSRKLGVNAGCDEKYVICFVFLLSVVIVMLAHAQLISVIMVSNGGVNQTR